MIEIDVWMDVRCPWCWIGLRRLERARAMVSEPFRVHRRSFLLEPQGPASPGRPTSEVATAQWGMSPVQWGAKSRLIRSAGLQEGLRLDVDGALMFDSAALHRLLKLAAEELHEDTGALWESAFAAQFVHLEDLGDPKVLRALASQWGLDEAAARSALAEGRYADEVARDIEEARRVSVTSIPTLNASDGRRLSGSASVQTMARLLGPGGWDR
ncbi:DsbA family protein [Nesterenkonia xinjiangensis]|uniref:Putative DsbA family dithiol-disulfide isomerase n=1 Tax=Nesterenkonia xinjiangensis TaxID=225327 RepID=A0A7Z0GKS9_9MICC|nr:putative DsbA family dithiol-disulfide isomerase [Nesterenkonia xinjiangensis]